jgi:NAD(P)-dependent dehydrogenase (short-subunit alcohol dehydrogenase family)
MSQRLRGRRILITGAASGIGRATATLFAKHGARLALLDTADSDVALLADELESHSIHADVTNVVAVRECIRQASKAVSGLDGVVNVAGIAGAQMLIDTDLERWKRILDVNLSGPMIVTQAALPFLMENESATVVNVASAIALRPFAGQGAYAASKAGLLAWTKVLAQELAPRIRVNATCPGPTDTPLMRAHMSQFVNAEHLTAQLALRRQGTALEQAEAILFLTGPESTFITGIGLAVDGGRTFH